MMTGFDERSHVVGLASPADSGGVAVSSDIVDFRYYHGADFLVYFGTITGDTIALTLEECDDVTPSSSTAMAFSYRESGATGTSDAFGAITDAAAAGVTVAATDDDHVFLISIDAAELTDGYPCIRIVATPGGSCTVSEIAILAVMRPRYAKNAQLSALT